MCSQNSGADQRLVFAYAKSGFLMAQLIYMIGIAFPNLTSLYLCHFLISFLI